MRTRPGRPARSQKAQHFIAAFIPALIVVLSITGFVWAQKPVTVVVDGKPTAIRTQARDVATALEENGMRIAEGDVVSPPLCTRVTPKMTVTIRRAVPVKIAFGSQVMRVAVIGRTVADALVSVGVDPLRNIVVSPALDAPLKRDMTIEAPQAFIRVSQTRQQVEPTTISRSDATLPLGQQKVVAEGAPGQELVVYRTVVCGGEEGPRTIAARTVTRQPKPRIIAVGSAATISQLVWVANRDTAGGVAPSGGRAFQAVATGYSAAEPGLTSATASGVHGQRGVIAVDPDVIPLGTRLYVPGYGWGVAADTGGAIKGNRIDLYFDTVEQCNDWGVRAVTITVFD